jgi:hypothetical protein
MLSGDWIPLGLPARIKAMATGATVYSLGGATEGLDLVELVRGAPHRAALALDPVRLAARQPVVPRPRRRG